MSHSQDWDADRALARIQELERLPGALLPILHALQDEFGYVDKAAVPMIAKRSIYRTQRFTALSASITIFVTRNRAGTF